MKFKTTLKLLICAAIILAFACDEDLDQCFQTICDGPDNTNCREEPVFDSGCFPLPENTPVDAIKKRDLLR